MARGKVTTSIQSLTADLSHAKAVRPLLLWLQQYASKPLPFDNDTPDLDEAGRRAYVEQLAQLRAEQAKKQEI
jgi:hypothetical protein